MSIKMKTFIVLGFFLAAPFLCTFAQVGINNDNSAPDNSAMLDVKSTTKGTLLPRMTFEQRNSIQNPIEGLIVYCTNCNSDGSGTIAIYQGGNWINLAIGICDTPLPPPSGDHIPSVTDIIWKWNKVPIATGYKWNTINNYNTAIDVGSDTSKTEIGLTCWTTYSRYLWAYNTCGNSSVSALTQGTSSVPFSTSPTEGIHVAGPTTIVWNWNPVVGATGYKWNITNDFSTAIEMATATSKSEIGLSINTSYTRYVWAYNGCGYSTPVSLTQTTLLNLTCGSSITINHVAGVVAPVTKTVIYEIITNLPGLPSVCWITRNLGASQQATAVNDATEPSAGWYWQFNHKQGYQYTTVRTPNTTWINPISEDLDWLPTNDPCTIELGPGWRIPTYTEWDNVKTAGNWTNWNGPWGSTLKMHAAGNLQVNNGSLSSRGSSGYYSSSTQQPLLWGILISFSSSNCYMAGIYKTFGASIRCLRDY